MTELLMHVNGSPRQPQDAPQRISTNFRLASLVCIILSVLTVLSPEGSGLARALCVVWTVILLLAMGTRWLTEPLAPVWLFLASFLAVFGPRFWHYQLWFDVPAGLLALTIGQDQLGPLTVATNLACLLALVNFLAGAAITSRMDFFRPRRARFGTDIALPMALAFLAVGSAACLIFIQQSGMDYAALVLDPTDRSEFGAGQGYVTLLARFAPAGLVLLYWRECMTGRQRWWLVGPVALGVLTLFLVFGQRSKVVLPFIGILVIHHFLWRRLKGPRMAAFGAALIAAMTFYLLYRNWTASSDDNTSLASYVLSALGTLQYVSGQITRAFTTFDGFALVVGNDSPMLLGASYASVVVQAIPSTLWPDKAGSFFSLGHWVAWMYIPAMAEGGVPPTFLGEAYVNFGWLGMPVAALIAGLLVGITGSWFRARRGDPVAVLTYAIVAPNIFMMVWGNMTTWFHSLVADMLIALLAAAVLRSAIRQVGSDHRRPPKWRCDRKESD